MAIMIWIELRAVAFQLFSAVVTVHSAISSAPRATVTADIPPGFELQDAATVSPASQAVQPVYHKRVGVVWHYATRVARQHCNSAGFLHGGVVAMFADNALWEAYYEAIDRRTSRIVTTSLTVDYLGITSVGQWFEVAPRIVKAGKSSGVIDALMTADGQIVGRAHGSFRALD